MNTLFFARRFDKSFFFFFILIFKIFPLIFSLAFSKVFHISLRKENLNNNVSYFYDILNEIQGKDTIVFYDKLINSYSDFKKLQKIFHLKELSKYIIFDFDGMVIDGSSIFEPLINMPLLDKFQIMNITFLNFSQPIFFLNQRSLLSLKNLCIVNSTFINISEVISVPYSQILIENLSLSNIEFYCSSLLTCFQTYLTIDNFESNLIYLNESSLMNIVDSTLEINHVLFERIWKSECYCGVFDLIGSSFLCINDIVLNNLSFFSSFFIKSDYNSDINIIGMTMKDSFNAHLFHGFCNSFMISNCNFSNIISDFDEYFLNINSLNGEANFEDIVFLNLSYAPLLHISNASFLHIHNLHLDIFSENISAINIVHIQNVFYGKITNSIINSPNFSSPFFFIEKVLNMTFANNEFIFDSFASHYIISDEFTYLNLSNSYFISNHFEEHYYPIAVYGAFSINNVSCLIPETISYTKQNIIPYDNSTLEQLFYYFVLPISFLVYIFILLIVLNFKIMI